MWPTERVAMMTVEGDRMGTAAQGRADVLDLLMQEHREVEELLQRVRHAGDAPTRRALADILIVHLVRHSLAEEVYVYPVLRDHLVHGAESVEHDRGEHDELEYLLRELESVDSADPRFMEVVVDLQAVLTHHMADEEAEQFPLVRLAAPADDLVALRGQVERLARLAPTPGPADAPDGEQLGTLVLPGVGMVDRARDALSGRLAASVEGVPSP